MTSFVQAPQIVMKQRFRIFAFFSLILLLSPLQAQVPSLFESDDLLEIYLRADWDPFIADRSDSAEYQSALLTYLEEGRQQVLPAKIRVRGNFRRRADICDFPPIRLKLKKEVAEGTIFEGNTKLKMVTHCQEEIFVLREYLVYHLYRTMVGDGFRVRLAKVNYVDKATDDLRETRYAFFIESEKMLEERLQGEFLEEIVPKESLAHQDVTRLMVFQYMMGNKDWSLVMSKNIRLLQRPGDSQLHPVPYDFDWTGIVGVTYTGLDEHFDWRTPPPYCRTREEYEAYIAELVEKEKEAYGLIRTFPYLTREESRHMLQYLKKSYRLIKSPETIETVFLRVCRQIEQEGGE